MATATPAPCINVPSAHPLYILCVWVSAGPLKYPPPTLSGKRAQVYQRHDGPAQGRRAHLGYHRRPPAPLDWALKRAVAGDHAVALKWSMQPLFGITPEDTWWASSDIGWVVGHSYIVYGPLLHGCTSVVFEGKPGRAPGRCAGVVTTDGGAVGTPDAGAFFRVVQEHKVNALFCAPTALRAIKKEDPAGLLLRQYDLSSLRTLFLAGERSDPPTLEWAAERIGVPTVDNYWQTETGSPICINPAG